MRDRVPDRRRGLPAGTLLRALYASEVNAYDPAIAELLIELEEVHDDFSVDEWPQLLAHLGQRHAFV